MSLNDPKIRKALIPLLKKEHARTKDTVIIEELGLCQGSSRIDIAVINGIMHGYEIKSERDNLSRLPKQVETYNKIFDKVTIIACKRHLKKVEKIVPDWWAISEASNNFNGRVSINEFRQSNYNPSIDPNSIVQLIWRNEALHTLESIGLKKGMTKMPRKELWQKLSSNLQLQDLKTFVREHIKTRIHWRSVHLPL